MNKIFGILEQLELENELYVVDNFMANLNKMCDNLEPLIISLSNQNTYFCNINEIYNIFYQINIESKILNIIQFVNICNIVENVLNDAIDLIGPASDELIDWLLLVLDQFSLYNNDFLNNKNYLSSLNPKIIKIPERLNR